MLADTDYPLLNIFWTMILVFVWIAWIWLLVICFMDIFRRHDIGGLGKAAWIIFMIAVPFVAVFIYIVAQGRGMAERRMGEDMQSQKQFDEYVKSVASQSPGTPADDIAKAQGLLDGGVINVAEFDQLKKQALAR